MRMTVGPRSILTVLLFAAAAVAQPALGADKKKPGDKAPPAANAEAEKAELNATLQLANIKVSRMALAEDAGLADVKEAVGGIYDRQESATKDAVSKLHAAGGD